MAKKTETDWKKEAEEITHDFFGTFRPTEGNNPGLVGRTLLAAGTRKAVGTGPSHSQGDAAINFGIRQRANAAEMKKRLEELKKRNPKTYRQRLKGLFGGGE